MTWLIDIPLDRYDTQLFNSQTDCNYERLKRLIEHTLSDFETEYEVCDKVFHYGKGNYEIGSRYGINFHIFEKACIVFSTQRDVAYPLAIFPLHNSHKAIEYFVCLVSEGKAKINWELFLDAAP